MIHKNRNYLKKMKMNPGQFHTLDLLLMEVFIFLEFLLINSVICDPMRLWNAKWAERFAPKSYDRESNLRASPNSGKLLKIIL